MTKVYPVLRLLTVWGVTTWGGVQVMEQMHGRLGPAFSIAGIDMDWGLLIGIGWGVIFTLRYWRTSQRGSVKKPIETPSASIAPQARSDRWTRFLLGLLWTAFVAMGFAACTELSYLSAFVTVLGIFLAFGGMALWWMTLWAKQKEARAGQFGIGSLLFVMVFVALFFGLVRWMLTRVAHHLPAGESVSWFALFAAVCFVVGLISLPFISGMGEALVWTAVWFVRRPRVRQWLALRKARSKVSGDSGPDASAE